MRNTSEDKTARLSAIQQLRGFAAMLVVISHATYSTYAGNDWFSPVIPYVRHLGSFGVTIFFVISGFIMVHTTRNQPAGLTAVRQFAYRRLIRIVPLYWLATTLVVLRALFSDPLPTADVIRSFLFIPFLNEQGVIQPVLHQGWTLNYEIYFYGLFSISLFLKRQLSVWVLCCALIVISIFGLMADHPTAAITFYTDLVILLFGLGCVLGLVVQSAPIRAILPPLTTLILTGVALALGMALVGASGSPNFQRPFSRGLFMLIGVICVGAGLIERPGEGLLSRTARRLGDASYSIYLFHIFALLALSKAMALVWPQAPSWLALALGVVGAAGIGWLIYAFVETPMLRVLKGVFESGAAPLKGPAGRGFQPIAKKSASDSRTGLFL